MAAFTADIILGVGSYQRARTWMERVFVWKWENMLTCIFLIFPQCLSTEPSIQGICKAEEYILREKEGYVRTLFDIFFHNVRNLREIECLCSVTAFNLDESGILLFGEVFKVLFF